MFTKSCQTMLSRIGIGSRSKLFPGPCSEIVTRINHIAGEGRFMNSQYLKVGPWIRCQSTGVETGRQTQPLKSTIVEEDGEPFRDFNDAGSVTGLDKEKETEEEFQIKMKLLDASLNYVNTMGWSTQALKAGAADLNLSEAIASLCTPFDLVEYFQHSANHQLMTYLKGLDPKEKSLFSSLEYRLKLVIPFINRYHEAMAISLEPPNVPRGLQILRDLSDTICINGLGDSSTDLRWYTKRTGIISLYIATECCMVQDKSEGYKETWGFLQRRVKDYEFFETVGATAFPILESGVTTLLNVVGMNRRR